MTCCRIASLCGINKSAISRRLLVENILAFRKAMEVSQGKEAAIKNAQTYQSSNGVGEVLPGVVHKLYAQQINRHQQLRAIGVKRADTCLLNVNIKIQSAIRVEK